MKIFNWEQFLNTNNKIAVHCKNEVEAISFCKEMDNRGQVWTSGQYYVDVNWFNIFKEKICYANNNTCLKYDDAKKYGYTILEWSDYMSMSFTKDDLKTGMAIELRDGTLYTVLRDVCETLWNNESNDLLINNDGWDELNEWTDNLLYAHDDSSVDIVKVYRPNHPYGIINLLYEDDKNETRKLIWERQEPIEMTMKELEEHFGYPIKIVKEKINAE